MDGKIWPLLSGQVWGLGREAHSAGVPGHIGEVLHNLERQDCNEQARQHSWTHVAPQPVIDGMDGAVPQSPQFCKKPGGKGRGTVAGPAKPSPSFGGEASLT